jgi:hypothetical protein
MVVNHHVGLEGLVPLQMGLTGVLASVKAVGQGQHVMNAPKDIGDRNVKVSTLHRVNGCRRLIGRMYRRMYTMR